MRTVIGLVTLRGSCAYKWLLVEWHKLLCKVFYFMAGSTFQELMQFWYRNRCFLHIFDLLYGNGAGQGKVFLVTQDTWKTIGQQTWDSQQLGQVVKNNMKALKMVHRLLKTSWRLSWYKRAIGRANKPITTLRAVIKWHERLRTETIVWNWCLQGNFLGIK